MDHRWAMYIAPSSTGNTAMDDYKDSAGIVVTKRDSTADEPGFIKAPWRPWACPAHTQQSGGLLFMRDQLYESPNLAINLRNLRLGSDNLYQRLEPRRRLWTSWALCIPLHRWASKSIKMVLPLTT